MSCTSFKGKISLTDAQGLVVIALVTAWKKVWWFQFFRMAVQGTNGNWLSNVITGWTGQSCHFGFTVKHKSVSNRCATKFKYPQRNFKTKPKFYSCLWDKELCWRQDFGLVIPWFIWKFAVVKASKCNSVSFCTAVAFRKWFLECVLKLRDTILVHLSNKWLCSLWQLYKLSVGWIFCCRFCPCCVNSIHLHRFNPIWLQGRKVWGIAAFSFRPAHCSGSHLLSLAALRLTSVRNWPKEEVLSSGSDKRG